MSPAVPIAHPRFTVRRMMVAVAAVALFLGGGVWVLDLARRSGEYRMKATEAAEQERILRDTTRRDPRWAAEFAEYARFWSSVKDKYDRAARYPWLPLPSVPADPVVGGDLPRPSAFRAPEPE